MLIPSRLNQTVRVVGTIKLWLIRDRNKQVTMHPKQTINVETLGESVDMFLLDTIYAAYKKAERIEKTIPSKSNRISLVSINRDIPAIIIVSA